MLRLFDHIPAACPLCEGRMLGLGLCTGCLEDLDHIEGRAGTSETSDARVRCGRCGLPRATEQAPCWACIQAPPPFHSVVVAMPYEPPYDTLVGRLKHRRQLWIANALGSLMARAAHEAWSDAPALLAPIPASRASLARRGFNPAGEIARAVGRRLGIPVRPDLLSRTRDSPKQSELGRQARLVESVDLFVAHQALDALHVGLVDDVMTTGGTLSAATEALLDRGCVRVSVVVAARTAR